MDLALRFVLVWSTENPFDRFGRWRRGIFYLAVPTLEVDTGLNNFFRWTIPICPGRVHTSNRMTNHLLYAFWSICLLSMRLFAVRLASNQFLSYTVISCNEARYERRSQSWKINQCKVAAFSCGGCTFSCGGSTLKRSVRNPREN